MSLGVSRGDTLCLSEGSFSDSDVVLVLGWDSLVVEDWKSDFLGRPTGCDGTVGALPTIENNTQWWS
ncbi:hypothetical protein FRC0546_01239 [Corynebacterium diphtheriae]|uniref:Uncharacterized protein n=1 Tax=Corynebacterium diphtheriae TaxID=1717 RepID=A0A811G4H1_CORDP|nr:hypothetical protein CIP107543_01226 [Corynebacterium diphtheriae]CAB0607089.1 hypothetical protein CIP107547_01553 [Corynebacterium diphtheriae]CAB0798867.1 hypothetical protein FRC0205_01214 [Corynebacterium diphtheriae]CAB0801945.1 hypothetical protein FRC0206_01368 [Corynebacterium diphtheriae]CAB0867549.1 hypothetical protein FRC0376_01445 [Corynebacterium diphtheriae]